MAIHQPICNAGRFNQRYAAFVINGYFISGAQPFAKFKKIIDKALAEAAKK